MADTGSERSERRLHVALVVGLAVVLAAGWVASRSGWFPPSRQVRVVVLYCFSALDDAMQDRLLPAFRDRWQREEDEIVEFVATFSGSGDITKRILAEYPAQVAIVSSELDAHQLPTPWRSWKELPQDGILARSPLVIVVREGNPLAIRDFADLGGEGVEVLHGDPATSGAAGLAILAEYGAALRRHGDGEAAYRQLLGIWSNVTARPATARLVRSRFESGEGDALITYAADAVGSPSRAPIRGLVVTPASTILAEPVVVKIFKNIDDEDRRLVDAFVDYLWSREAQQTLVDYGYQSVFEELNEPRGTPVTVPEPFGLEDVGGVTARREILEKVWRDRVLRELQRRAD